MAKNPKSKKQPSAQKIPKAGANKDFYKTHNFRWKTREHDIHYPWFQDSALRISIDALMDKVIPHLHDLETQTWDEILSASGGKTRGGTNNHAVPCSDLCGDAQKQLGVLQLEVDELVSIRMTNLCRLWGHREGAIFNFLWYDPEHQVCPSSP